MRISFGMQTSEALLTLNDKQEQINQLSQQISSGVKLSSPADDPYSWAQAMNVKQGLRQYQSIMSNITYATGWEQTSNSALSQLSNLVSQAKQAAISATSGTGTDQSTALATQVDGILQQALNLANSQYGDQYIFAGAKTATAPFTIDNSTGAVTYNGDTGSISVRTDLSGVSSGPTVINQDGQQVFSYSSGGSTLNVLNEIWGLEHALKTGDTATISSKITTLGDAFNNINNETAINGDRLSALSTQKSAISIFQTNVQDELSNLQDTDIAAAATTLQQAQTAYDAALKVAGMLDNLNLASYFASSSTG